MMMDCGTQTYDDPGSGRGRVEIDTSAPFGSVEEAVIYFGGRGFWAPPTIHEEYDMCKLEEQAAEMLKDLDTKRQETLNILKELELTKRLIQQLKLKLHQETSEPLILEPSSNIPPQSPVAVVMTELKQAKQNLSQRTNDLESIRASVECVNKKMVKPVLHNENNSNNNNKTVYPGSEEMFKARVNGVIQSGKEREMGISRELRELNLGAEQFMETAEAAKAEVLRAMCEIEKTKTGLKMIEMRWVAAKKLEEAAKATEALALAEIKALSNNKECRVSLSMEEYSSLAEKARKADEKAVETSLKELMMSRVEDRNRRTTRKPCLNNNAARFERPISMGEVVSRKLVLRDDLDVGRKKNERQRESLDQMLTRHRAESPPPPPHMRRNETMRTSNGGFFSKRRNFHISFPISKQSKNRIQALNLW